MHTLSSARRTCMASASAVECTATVATPSSLQARSMRRAISPRVAIRILSNIAPRLGRTIGGAHHRRGHRAGMDDELLGPRWGPRVLSRCGLGDVGGECGRKVHPTRDPDPFPLVLDLDLGATS